VAKPKRVITADGSEIVVTGKKMQVIRIFAGDTEVPGHCCTTEAMAKEYVSMAPSLLRYTIEDIPPKDNP
jgi:hypothetical protein